jgi:hypothetical protein
LFLQSVTVLVGVSQAPGGIINPLLIISNFVLWDRNLNNLEKMVRTWLILILNHFFKTKINSNYV